MSGLHDPRVPAVLVCYPGKLSVKMMHLLSNYSIVTGKLKLISEMKEKLEAVHGGSRKSSVRSTGTSDGHRKRSGLVEMEFGAEEGGTVEVKKLEENRKLLLEQKLGGGKKSKAHLLVATTPYTFFFF